MRTVDTHREAFDPLVEPRPNGSHPTVAPNGARRDAAPSAAPPGSVLWLTDPEAGDPERTGAKAAALARAALAGLPVLPGFVVTTAATGQWAIDLSPSLETDLRTAWCDLTESGSRAVVVRSSSVVEDGRTSSMAGMFTSQLDVRGWDSFLDSVAAVLRSGRAVPGVETAAMAVLVQPMLVPRFGGVLFGADPVTGRTDRLVVAAVEGGPHQLVSGEVDGARYVLSRRGRSVSSERPLAAFGRVERRALVDLGHRAAQVFDGPQDVEWAIDDDGRVHLLQSRPITATGGAAAVRGPVLGPGPVAETFPEPLSTLEEDLWVTPLREAVASALRLTGTATRRAIDRSPVVTSVAGRVAADLELFGTEPRRHTFLRRLDPRPPARRLVAAWRVGRLRAALPGLADDVVAGADARLLEVPDLHELHDRELVSVLRGTGPVLRALHGHEVLAGLLVDEGAGATTAASVALQVLGEGRAAGRSDAETTASEPVVLALTSPRVGPEAALPPVPAALAAAAPVTAPDRLSVLREALRLRARWTQELGARAAWELGLRLHERGALLDPEAVRHLTLDELDAVVAGADAPGARIRQRRERPEPAPLPAAFRLTATAEVVAVALPSGGSTGGAGAGGGRAVGRVHAGGGAPPPAGAILVVRTLDPGLAPLLPQLGGLVAETGSVLSHLAILARELGVPTVVGEAGATDRLQPGTTVLVDGTTGEVTTVSDDPVGAELPNGSGGRA